MTKVLHALARAAGIAIHWQDAGGKRHRICVKSLKAILKALDLPAENEHQIAQSHRKLHRQRENPALTVVPQNARFPAKGRRLTLIDEKGARHVLPVKNKHAQACIPIGYYRMGKKRFAVTPARAFMPPKKVWGVAVQLYALKGAPGIGDFGALAQFAEDAARAGAGAILLSPVHALPENGISPYTPTSRRFLNPLYAPVAAADNAAALIDWERVRKARMAALAKSFAREKTLTKEKPDAALRRHARFMAQDKNGVDFQIYLQRRAEAALAMAQHRAKKAGMPIGLISDVAVGVDPQGSDVAAQPDTMLQDLTIGAPADTFNAQGQNWGLTTFSPQGLIATGFEGFIAMLRAAMRHAGGIRLDHAMGLMRLWVVPGGFQAKDGAYLHYPFADLLGLLCLESQRHQAVVVAEDLGTVPKAFRAPHPPGRPDGHVGAVVHQGWQRRLSQTCRLAQLQCRAHHHP
jgi:4-alpha-glucanotransferase